MADEAKPVAAASTGPAPAAAAAPNPAGSHLTDALARSQHSQLQLQQDAADPPLSQSLKNGASKWLLQMFALTSKCFRMLSRRLILVALIVLLPLAFVLFFNGVADTQTVYSSADTSVGFSRCSSFNAADVKDDASCLTVVYAPSNPTTDSIMSALASATNLRMGTDVVGEADRDAVAGLVYDHVATRQQLVEAAIVFDDPLPAPDGTIHYELWVNATLPGAYDSRLYRATRYNPRSLGLQAAVDQAILRHVSGVSSASIDVTVSTFSILVDGVEGKDETVRFVLEFGPLFMAVGSAFVGLIVLFTVITEKRLSLLGLLRNTGLYESTHWLSWLLTLLPILALASIGNTAVGISTGLKVWTEASFFAHFFAYFLLLLATTSMMLFFASFVRQGKWVGLVMVFVLLLAVLIPLFIGTSDAFDSIYKGTVPIWEILMFWVPWFHYGRVFAGIVNHQDTESADGSVRFFSMGDLESSPSRRGYTPPTLAFSMWMMVCDCLVYLFLAWYCGQVFAGDLGQSQQFYFPVDPVYWGCTRRKAKSELASDTLDREQRLSANSLRCFKATKSYEKNTAMKEVTLHMDAGKITTLLGSNGAGKSTLVKTLSGLLTPTHGEVFLFGKSMREESSTLRGYIGTCPQHDLLWEDLSPAAHVALFSRFRARGWVPKATIQDTVASVLGSVNLAHVAHQPVATFSGGMRRRLSLALSTIGSPRVMFLDEPTTGLDPQSRHAVWRLIEQLKKDRIVILTTHSLQEADAISDEVVLLHGGRVRAFGPPLTLKGKFGSGWTLTLLLANSDQSTRADVMDLVHKSLPGAQLVAGSVDSSQAPIPGMAADSTSDTSSSSVGAGSLSVAVPKERTDHIPAFLRLLAAQMDSTESGAAQRKLVRDFSLSTSTLEEVFLKLVAQNKGVNYVSGGMERASVCVLCRERPPESVVLYTEEKVRVQCADLICSLCADRDKADFEKMYADRAAAVTAAASATASVASSADVGGLDADESKLDGGGEEKAGVAEAKSSAAAAGPSTGGPSTGGGGAAGGAPKASPHRKDRPPVSAWRQFKALLLLRLAQGLQQLKAVVALLVVVVLILCVLLFLPSSSTRLGPRCSAGFNLVAGTETDQLCYRGNWTSYFADGAARAEVDTAACGYGSSSVSVNPRPQVSNSFLPVCLATAPSGLCTSCSVFPNLLATQALEAPSAGSFPANQSIWYQDASTGDAFATYDPLWLGAGTLTTTLGDGVGFEAQASTKDINADVFSSQQSVRDAGTTLPAGCGATTGLLDATEAGAYGTVRSSFPDWSVSFSAADSGSLSWGYNIRLYRRNNDDSDRELLSSQYRYTRAFSDETGSCLEYGINSEFSNTAAGPATAALSTVNAAVFRKALTPTTQLRTSVLSFPAVQFSDSSGSGSFMFSVLIPIIVLIPLPSFATYISSEKDLGLYQMMLASGMRAFTYWLSAFAYCFVFFLLYMLFVVLAAEIFAIKEFKNNGFGVLLAACLTWAYSACGYSFLIGGMFRDPDSASLFAKLLIIVAVLVNMAFADVDEWMRVFLYVPLPVLGFLRSFSLMLEFMSDEIDDGSEIQAGLVASFITSTVALLLGPYLHAVVPNQNANIGTPAHPLFFLKWFVKEGDGAPSRDGSRRPSAGADAPPHTRLGVAPPPLPEQYQDEDVIAEHARVESGNVPASTVVMVKDLAMGFPVKGATADRGGKSVHWAVKGVSLALGPGCHGALGPNGAGKSTLINMLVGNLVPTSGSASIGGFDVATEMTHIHRILGICPQFDTVFSDLSVKQQLTFYARLKGIPESDVMAAVREAAERVELDGDAFDVSANGLSGGMRRRLSLAVALLGDPQVVLLDEPTTGLDPLTVRSIWDIIQRENSKGRCIVITTHSMDEAEALCPNIAIMVNGRLSAIGEQTHLRSKFGDGFKLWMALASDSDEAYDAVNTWITTEAAAGARPSSRVGKYVSFNLPTGVDIATLFELLERQKVTLGIVEHGLNNASLDRVFSNVVDSAARAEENVKQGAGESPL